MSKVTIDTKIWATPSQYAAEKKVERNVVSNWIKRGKLQVWEVKELGIRLIKR